MMFIPEKASNATYTNRYSQVNIRIMKCIEISFLFIILLVSCQIEAETENIEDEQKINLNSNDSLLTMFKREVKFY